MNTQSSFYRLAIPIYAFIIAIFHFGIIMPSINLGFQHPYLRAVANSDLIIAAVLIVAAIGVIRKTRWAGSLYIFSMGMIVPELIKTFSNMIGNSYYIYSVITLVLIILAILFAVKVRSVTGK